MNKYYNRKENFKAKLLQWASENIHREIFQEEIWGMVSGTHYLPEFVNNSHRTKSFLLMISSVNVTKSAVSFGFGHKSLMEKFIFCAVSVKQIVPK